MIRLLAAFSACALFTASPVFAQVRVEVNVPVPTITFTAPPPLVVVQPGVQVVEDSDDEVFFVDGFYWSRRDGHWFRTRTHTGGWTLVEQRHVPHSIVGVAPGHYRRWKRERAPATVDSPDRGKTKGKESKHEEHGHGKH